MAAFAFLVNAYGLRLTHNGSLARVGFLSVLMAVLLVMLVTGGTAGTGIYWFFVFPVGAFFLGGKREGVWWMLGILGMIAAVWGMAWIAAIRIPYEHTEIRQLLVSLAIVAAGIYVYQRSRETLQTETDASRVALQTANLRADSILANIDEGVVAIDAEGRVVSINPAAEAMLGWRSADLTGRAFTVHVPLLDEQGIALPVDERPLMKVLHRQTSLNDTYVYQRKDGTTFPAAITARPLVSDEKVVGAIAAFRDITEERQVDRAKSEFVTLASHQLRTPITSIAWLCEMLLHGDAGKLKEEQHTYIEQVAVSNRRSLAIVDAMLQMSTLELGDVDVVPTAMDLPVVTHEIVTAQLKSQPVH
jgi:PAS domain S-box-containing protein